MVRKIEVVIPTFNRKANLLRCLTALNASSLPIQTVIIVDGGTQNISEEEILLFPELSIQVFHTRGHVCYQRNFGIQHCSSTWILLCDDDIELAPDYLQILLAQLEKNPKYIAVSGIVLQQEKGEWVSTYPVESGFGLLFRLVFQMGVWGEIKRKQNLFSKLLVSYFGKRKNHISKAGWPVITHFANPSFETPIYGLGASLIGRQFLLENPFEEILDSNGIGDNYGVAIQLPGPILVDQNAKAFHLQAEENRESTLKRDMKRIFALHFFIVSSGKFKLQTRFWFLWSLIGKALLSIFHADFRSAKSGTSALLKICWGQNPYLIRKKARVNGL